MMSVRRLAGFLLLVLLLSGCSKKSPSNSVKITDYLSLTDKNGHTVSYGMDRNRINSMFNTGPIDVQWESAHENLEIKLTSSIEFANPTIVQLSVTSQEDHTEPSWTLPQGVRIGSSKQEVLQAFDKTITGEILDIFFAQDPKYIGQMYEIPEDKLESMDETIVIYRMVLQFRDETLDTIVLGDLNSMS